MILKPYKDLTINLTGATTIAYYPSKEAPEYFNLYIDEKIFKNDQEQPALFHKEVIEDMFSDIRNGADKLDQHYYGLFTNMFINLDDLISISVQDNQISLVHTKGKWKSMPFPEAQQTMEACSGRMKMLQLDPSFKGGLKKVWSGGQPAQEKEKPANSKPAGGVKGKFDPDALEKALTNIDKMIGLDAAKGEIRQNIALARFNALKEEIGISVAGVSRHMVFTGNPGTGKTTFAREVAKIYHALGFLSTDKVKEVSRDKLVGRYVGETAIKTNEALEEARGGVLFIDEAYSLARSKAAFRDSFGTEALDTLTSAMENMRDDLVVIVAGYPGPMKEFIASNEGLKSRFTNFINFDDYSMENLGDIMDLMLKERGYTIEPEAKAYALQLLETEKTMSLARNGETPDFGNAREVRNIVEKAEKFMALRLDKEGYLSTTDISQDDLKAKLTTVTFDDVKDISVSPVALNIVEEERQPIGFAIPKRVGRTITPDQMNVPQQEKIAVAKTGTAATVSKPKGL